MKKYFDHLRPMERRLVVGVGVVLFLVINAWQVWPHFADWGNLSHRRSSAQSKLGIYQKGVAEIPKLRADVDQYESTGDVVAPADQGINMMRTIQSQAAECGFGIQSFSRQSVRDSDPFSIEQSQNITVIATEEQLVKFLYHIGSGASMIRVRDLSLQPDTPHYHLTANIRLVATYQKNVKKPAPATAATPVATNKPAIALPGKGANIFGHAPRATNSPAIKK